MKKVKVSPEGSLQKESPNKIIIAVLVCMGMMIVCLAIWTIWGNTALMVSEISVSSDRLPDSFSGCCIAQISDLHNAEFGDENEKLLRMLSESKPDIIVITGDLIDSRRTDTDVAIRFAKEAAEIAPTYYVTGNHEARMEHYEELKFSLVNAGVTVLEDETAVWERNSQTVRLLGLNDPDFTIKGDLFGEIPAMASTKLQAMLGEETGYTILLSHRPELFDTYASCGIDLVLSGHAHGGQFRLPFIGGLYAPGQGFFPKYDAGLYTKDRTSMAVSRGLGNSIIPIRFNNPPEMILIKLSTGEK